MLKNAIGYAKRAKYIAKTRFKFASLSKAKQKKIVDDFHSLYYDSHVLGKTWHETTFLGVPIQKNPLDLFVYQEILFDIKPDVIIEAGTAYGGGALYLAGLCDLMNHGSVITIDVNNVRKSPKHSRITYLIGSSTSEKIFAAVKKAVKGKKKVLIILDSDHSKKHVLAELILYSPLVTKGSYIITEDTNVNGNPVYTEHGDGPMEAITEFLKTNNSFESDSKREKFYFTYNPKGYLKRIK